MSSRLAYATIAAIAYGEHKRFDFFVQHLLGVQPPDWNSRPTTTESRQ